MPKKKSPCPEKGTLDVFKAYNPRIHLACVYHEGGEHDKFVQVFKDLFHDKSAITNAMRKILADEKIASYLADDVPELAQIITILNNATKGDKLHAWKGSKEIDILVKVLDHFTFLTNKYEKFAKKNLKHCKEKTK